MKTGFGLDLSGYSSRGSAFARAVRSDDHSISVTVFRDCCFSAKTHGKDRLDAVNVDELRTIKDCLQSGILVVDVCIDLQGLPAPDSAEHVWQLIRRPVDRAFDALAPLADQIGAYVARMQRLWSLLIREGSNPLDVSLFETYPAACLELMDLKAHRKGYKGQAAFDGEHWRGRGAEKEAEQRKNDKLAGILNILKWIATPETLVSHDDFDAALCAIVAVCNDDERLAGERLSAEINSRLIKNGSVPSKSSLRFKAPKGYALLAKRIEHVCVKLG